MIVSHAVGDVAVLAGSQPAGWQSLIRRGMLHSECEGVEYWDLPAGSRLSVRADHGVEEAVLVLRGEIALHEPGGETTRAAAGQLLLIPHGLDGELRTGQGSAAVVVIRGLAGQVSGQLPPRVPELLAG